MTKEEEILNAADAVFLEKGYDATTTAEIAKRAGVTHAMVNYYFRTKEQLFARVLNSLFQELHGRVMALMTTEGEFVDVVADAALAIFDVLNEKRNLPFLIQNISRSHPEFLERFQGAVNTVCMDSIRMHSDRLSSQRRAGLVSECSMNDIYDTVLSLSFAPFLMIPTLKNLLCMSEERIEQYLQEHRSEMVRLVRARYGTSVSGLRNDPAHQ